MFELASFPAGNAVVGALGDRTSLVKAGPLGGPLKVSTLLSSSWLTMM